MACLEATYEHWKADTDQRDAKWEREAEGPEGYDENEGYVFDFFIPVTDGDHTIHVLAPYVVLDWEQQFLLPCSSGQLCILYTGDQVH